MKTIILGAGITGLTAGYDTDAEIYEARDIAGGLCVSKQFFDYKYDESGGHWIFGLTPKVNDFFAELGVELKETDKNAGVYLNRIINGSIQDFANQKGNISPNTMKQYFHEKFGTHLCNLFFYPFNERYTNGLYEMAKMENEYKTPQNTSTYNDTFAYPVDTLKGLIDKLEEKCTIHYNHKLTAINIKDKRLVFNDGKEVFYDRLISTIPLCDLFGIDLPFVSVKVFNVVGKKGYNFPEEQWLYIPYGRFYRVGFYNNAFSNFSREGTAVAYVESTDMDLTPDEVAHKLKEWKWLQYTNVIDTKEIPIAYTYVLPSTPDIQYYLNLLSAQNIHSIGRYGKWRFQGMSECINDGLTTKEKLCL